MKGFIALLALFAVTAQASDGFHPGEYLYPNAKPSYVPFDASKACIHDVRLILTNGDYQCGDECELLRVVPVRPKLAPGTGWMRAPGVKYIRFDSKWSPDSPWIDLLTTAGVHSPHLKVQYTVNGVRKTYFTRQNVLVCE